MIVLDRPVSGVQTLALPAKDMSVTVRAQRARLGGGLCVRWAEGCVCGGRRVVGQGGGSARRRGEGLRN